VHAIKTLELEAEADCSANHACRRKCVYISNTLAVFYSVHLPSFPDLGLGASHFAALQHKCSPRSRCVDRNTVPKTVCVRTHVHACCWMNIHGAFPSP